MDLSNGVVDVSSTMIVEEVKQEKQDSFIASIMSKLDMATCIGGGLAPGSVSGFRLAAGFAGALGPKKPTAPNKNSIFYHQCFLKESL